MSNSNSFPLVPRTSVIKNLLKFVANPIPSLFEFQEKYGDSFFMYIGGVQKGLLTSDAELFQNVFQKQHRKFEKSKMQTELTAKYLGKGLLTNKGADWLRQRRLIQPGFHKEKIENLIHLMMKVIEPFSEKINKEEGSEKINISNAMYELSFEIIARTLVSQPIPKEELDLMNHTISHVQDFVVKQVRLPFLSPYFKLTGQVKNNINKVNNVRNQLLKYVNQRRSNPTDDSDLLNMLLEARYEDNGEPMSDERLIDEMLILFIAGHETSANALSWTWYLLDKHPEAFQKIREEADSFFKNEITLESIRSLSYTSRVINESMRLYPPAWITDRIALEDIELSDTEFKKGEMVMPFIYGLHHNPKYWKDPFSFNPDRFLPEEIAKRPKFSYMPFGGGPRFCIGNNFALIEMQLTVAYLCSKYDIKRADQDPIEIKPLITLRMDRDLEMFFTPRKSN